MVPEGLPGSCLGEAFPGLLHAAPGAAESLWVEANTVVSCRGVGRQRAHAGPGGPAGRMGKGGGGGGVGVGRNLPSTL